MYKINFRYTKRFISLMVCIALLMPLSAYAADIISTINTITGYFNSLFPLFMTLGIVYFLWGLVKLIWNAEDEKARMEGKNMMIWGMIALFVMVGFWSIIGYVQASFNIGTVGVTGTGPAFPTTFPW